jgi:hypothetical protein
VRPAFHLKESFMSGTDLSFNNAIAGALGVRPTVTPLITSHLHPELQSKNQEKILKEPSAWDRPRQQRPCHATKQGRGPDGLHRKSAAI